MFTNQQDNMQKLPDEVRRDYSTKIVEAVKEDLRSRSEAYNTIEPMEVDYPDVEVEDMEVDYPDVEVEDMEVDYPDVEMEDMEVDYPDMDKQVNELCSQFERLSL